ncbi:MAG: phage tail sheath family protein [Acidobacteria bacterium]|nr:phage tail sheath family protein [Acidobacteriota bacterium]
MPEYLSPGVYVEEIAGPRAIEGVGTSTSGFVGQTERGPTAPQLVTSWLDYQRWYGGYIDSAISYLPFAVKGFFDNGGARAFIARVHRTRADGADDAEFSLPTAVGTQNLVVQANGLGEWGNRIFARVRDASQPGGVAKFRLTLIYYSVPPVPFVDPLDPLNIANPDRRDPDVVEDYDNLGIDPIGPNYALTTVNSASKLVHLSWTVPADPAARPNNVGFAAAQLTGGDDGAGPIGTNPYLGLPTPDPVNERTGLAGLGAIDEVAMLTIPDHVHPSFSAAEQSVLMNEIVNQCELLKDRFAVLNIAGNQGNVTNVNPPRDSSYGAVYYPWIRIFDSRTRDTLLVPPSGHVMGIYARTDIERGVHKAPANEVVRGIVNQDLNSVRKPVEYQITKGQQDILNPKGVNAIRDFRPDRRDIRVWGARTMSSDSAWRYVNVRRLFIFIEESIDQGTQFVVFEPNDEPTWAIVRRVITNFLTSVWRSGALMGTTQEQAFFVKCDRTTMTEDDILNGRLICYIGIAPVRPAEFVIFRISQKTAEA